MTRFVGYDVRSSFAGLHVAYRWSADRFSVLDDSGAVIASDFSTREEAELAAMDHTFGPSEETWLGASPENIPLQAGA